MRFVVAACILLGSGGAFADTSPRRSPIELILVSASGPSPWIAAYHFATGARVWSSNLPELGSPFWMAQPRGGHVYSAGPAIGVLAHDLRSGVESWRYEFKGLVDLRLGDGAVFAAGPARAVCLDASTGAERWVHGVGVNHGSMTLGQDGVVLVRGDGRVVMLEAKDGRVRWSTDAGARPGRVQTVEGAVVTACSTGGRVRCLDARNGKERWSLEGFGDRCSPWVERGRLLVTDDQNRIRSVDAANGRVRWEFQGAGRIRSSTPRHLLIEAATGLAACLDIDTGRVIWKREDAIGRNRSIAVDTVVTCWLRDGANVSAVDPHTGRETLSFAVKARRMWACAGDRQAFVLTDETLRAFDTRAGRELWSFDCAGQFARVELLSRDLIVTTDKRIVRIDALTGRRHWISDLPAPSEYRWVKPHPDPRP